MMSRIFHADHACISSGLGYGLAVSVVMDPTVARGARLSGVGEYGWGGVANTWFSVDPAKDLLTILFTQVIPSTAYPIRPQLRYLSHWAHQ